MDTSGKGGVLRNVVGLFDPQGVHIKAFKAPTAEEREARLPVADREGSAAAGKIGVFDRSHYEDVLIARVRKLAPAREIERRYGAINEFEARLAATGTAVDQVHAAHLLRGAEDAAARAPRRSREALEVQPGRRRRARALAEYQAAYELALERCNTDAAPWLIVPSDRKWYKNWAVARVLRETLAAMDLDWPTADFDVEEQKRRLERDVDRNGLSLGNGAGLRDRHPRSPRPAGVEPLPLARGGRARRDLGARRARGHDRRSARQRARGAGHARPLRDPGRARRHGLHRGRARGSAVLRPPHRPPRPPAPVPDHALALRARDLRDRVLGRLLDLRRVPLPDRHGDRRRVRRDQLGDRRADPRAHARLRRASRSTAATGSARRSARCSPRCCSIRACSGTSSAGAPRSGSAPCSRSAS